MKRYEPDVEETMKIFYDNLSEKDKRYYAGVEAAKFGYGGIQYLAKLFGCSRQTVSKGLKTLKNKALLDANRARKTGGGRKSHKEKHPDINTFFFKSC